ncbi:MAG TPA: tRNA lysidine(34) synthetase TilS [Flavobacteriales bacterium]|jgi:tRNA(Ile)-lysidine synthase|nr:tRNA lysidine(34) synthetase TilS [Flavobacteriales bacterium]
MRAEVQRFIARERLLRAGEPTWVAVSGGVDSMVLLDVLRSLGHRCSVAHVDHGLRGTESDGDRVFVETYCAEHKIPFRAKRVDPKAHAEAYGGSVQMAARALRYAWFQELLAEGPSRLALGHHADDAVETLLLHLLRGMGIHGWATIRPMNDGFIRPLLSVDRAAIMTYAQERGVPFREDASNADPKYLRNRVRGEVLPLLEALRPGARRTMARSAAVLRELEALAEERMRAFAMDSGAEADGLRRLPLHLLTESITPLLRLRAWLGDADVHPDVIDQLLQAVHEGRTGAQFTVGDARVTVDREALILHRSVEAAFIEVHDGVPGGKGPFNWQFEASLPERFADAHTAWLDADRLQFPLVLRPWQQGDRMRPLGLNGSKLVSDLLIDAKMPMPMKARTYVLVSGGKVVWLAGLRLGEGVAATEGTQRVLRITREG